MFKQNIQKIIQVIMDIYNYLQTCKIPPFFL